MTMPLEGSLNACNREAGSMRRLESAEKSDRWSGEGPGDWEVGEEDQQWAFGGDHPPAAVPVIAAHCQSPTRASEDRRSPRPSGCPPHPPTL